MVTLSDIFTVETLLDNYNKFITPLMYKSVDSLSTTELSLIKCVSTSSIHSMKKNGRDNETILRTTQTSPKTPSTQQVKNYLLSLSPEERAALLEQ